MPVILLVEDAAILAGQIRIELENNHFEVYSSGDGLAALTAFSNHRPDLVILDWMLPGLDGLEVLKKIRQISTVPVLMLTARSEEVDRVIGLELGADDYLTKPFGMRELLARVHALLRRVENAQAILQTDQSDVAEVITYGDLVLNQAGYRARLVNKEIDLTRTEFDLLCLLARNPGRVFSRAYLLETIWGANYQTGDRSVDNTILRLRKKLGTYADKIEAVWGIGYRMNVLS